MVARTDPGEHDGPKSAGRLRFPGEHRTGKGGVVIRLAFLLARDHRRPDRAQAVAVRIADLGIQPTKVGMTSISAQVSEEQFAKIFGVPFKPVSPRPPGEDDAGAPGGFEVCQDLNVPEDLQGEVECVEVVAPASRFG